MKINLDVERFIREISMAQTPEYFREVMSLFQKRIRSLEELPYLTCYFFTDDVRLWEYCRRRLEAIQKNEEGSSLYHHLESIKSKS